MVKLTDRSMKLFLDYAEDADNWGGTPLVGGNVGGSKGDRGNITDLKMKGLITTFNHNGNMFIKFTDLGREVAKEHGVIIEECNL